VGALASVAGALARVALLGGSLPNRGYLTFYPAVALAALIGGARGGAVATILCAAAAHYFFFPLADSADWIGLIGFLISCAIIIGILELQRRAQERTILAEATRESEERYRLLTQAVPSMTFKCNSKGERIFVSDQWCAYTGIAMEKAIGDAWLNAEHPDRRETTARQWSDAVRAGQPCEIRHQIRSANGSYRWFLLRALPQRGVDGDVTGWACSCTDIDDLIRAETRLREADRRKDDFLAMLAHELRNPLAPIRNAVHLLRRIDRAEPIVETAREIIDRQVTHMVRLVDDLLDVNRLRHGRLLLQIERVDLARICRDTVADFRGAMSGDGLSLTADIPADPVWVSGDPIRLAQMLNNLLHNAQKFTDRGGSVVVKLSVEQGRTGANQAVLSVSDTGIGIAPEILPEVFEVFMQADNSLGRSRGGLGLGLALVKGLAERHGGAVTVESAGLARGAKFTLRLPLAQPIAEALEVEQNPADASAEGGRRRILLVEDNAFVAESLSMVLKLEGHTVEVAHSGKEAIADARAHRPQVALCDIGLPDMNGYEVARALRSDPATAEIFLVAITGYGSEKDRESSEAAGFDRHLTKPVSPEHLIAVLAEADQKASPLSA
jgi:PAS domain S-box-containing protein